MAALSIRLSLPKSALFSRGVRLALTWLIAGLLPLSGAKAVELGMDTDRASPSFGTLTLTGLGPELAARLGEDKQGWDRALALFAPASEEGFAALPVSGSHRIEGDRLLFRPQYPPLAGLTYLARSELSGKSLEARFTIPSAEPRARTRVQGIYPSTSLLPENLLKLYLHFSAPMSRGDAYSHLQLFDANGAPLPSPFLELPEELWDLSQTRLTLFLDPGRIKRGLRPHEEVGLALERGKSYALRISKQWRDARGRPLEEDFVKAFTVTAADRSSPWPSSWEIRPPKAGTREPLSLHFPESLDRALLGRLLTVHHGEKTLTGRVEISHDEQRWHFHPDQPWSEGPHHLEVGAWLEDLAGNNLNRVFDLDLLTQPEPGTARDAHRLPFSVPP